MTGRDLIVYILENNLEDKPVFNHGQFIGFLTAEEAASKLNVGLATIKAFVQEGWLEGIIIGQQLYIPADLKTNIQPKSV